MNNNRVTKIESYLSKIALQERLLKHYEGRNILITGGAGAIGSNLLIALSILTGKNGKVVILDNLSSIKYKDPWNVTPLTNVLFVEGDIRSDIDLKRVFKENISMVFHLAAFFANQNSIDYPEKSADVDIIGLIKLLEYTRLAKVDRFIFASSGCALYSPYENIPLKEDFITMHHTSPYQVNKMAGEMYCNFYNHHYNMNTVNCRFFNSYGPGEVPGQYRNVIPNFIYWSMKKQSLPITGTGDETRDFTFVLDLVQGLIKAGYYKKAIGESFNLASSKGISIKHMADLINETTGNLQPLIKKPKRKWDNKKHLLASVTKAEKLINYHPEIDFKDGLSMNIEWFSDNWDIIEKLADFNPGMTSTVR
jgi:nucleoside-diphosphate-sugar epimerase